ncbi:MAG TPA: T9SS type A sorting domain-containing protein [Ignavibacteriaceae bacterium]|nr:T9SS type A sorting domain-containing protein [Ignavibacteriaceae bacterium]
MPKNIILISGFNVNYQQGKKTKWYIWSNIFRHKNGEGLLNVNRLDPEEIKVFNNTLYSETASDPSFILYNLWNADGTKMTETSICTLKNFLLKNNIFSSQTDGQPLLKFGHKDSVKQDYGRIYFDTQSVSINNNCYYNNNVDSDIVVKYIGTNGGTLFNMDEWIQHGYDGLGINEDPLFVNSPPLNPDDFILDDYVTSPCINNGNLYSSPIVYEPYNLAFLETRLTTLDDNVWDMGAYEQNYIPQIPPQNRIVTATMDAYPSPFNPSTTISYYIPKDGKVSLKVYDVLGKELSTLVDEYKTSGNYSIKFNGENLSSGIYFYVLINNNLTNIKKMILLK